MFYLYWIGVLLTIGPVLIGLPLLSRNRVYRVATLFAGMNAGIVTLYLFMTLLRWGSGPAYAEQFHAYFTQGLPSLYIGSLAIGSTVIPRYYLNRLTQSGAILATLGSLFGVYVCSLIAARLLEIVDIFIKAGLPSYEILLDIMNNFLAALFSPSLSFVVLLFVSAFIALNGTAAAIRISDEAASSKREEIQ
jgi:hypothetical protein